MMKHEFESLANITLPQFAYDAINHDYMGCDLDKREYVSALLRDRRACLLLSAICRANEEIAKAQRECESMRAKANHYLRLFGSSLTL